MSKFIKGRTGDWEIVIGLEIHAQSISKAKLFSGASTAFGAEQNTQVSLVDAAMPGMLPVLNEESVRQAVRSGLALNSKINLHSVFARKNYFYPDLPQGYQISQYESPIVGEGEIEIDLANGETVIVGIERLHLEQDAGKSLHDQHPTKTYIDLNRAGVTLMEIVSKPDMHSSEEAVAYVTKVRSILRYIDSCDGNMQEGSLRCDANVSMRRPGADLGTRCEIKNLNSFRFLKQAIDYEAVRQVEILEDGGKIAQETRLYDTSKGETRSMRSKEEAHDYRYFPDPDLLPIELDEDFVAAMKASLPELPDARKARFVSAYELSPYDASVLVSERDTADYFETVATGRDPKLAANWVISDLFGRLNKASIPVSESPVSAESLGELIDLISDETISGRIAKDVFTEMFDTREGAAAIVEKKGLRQVTDEGAIKGEVQAIIDANPDKVADYRAGNEKLIGWFMGQVMKVTQGKANPGMVNQLLRDLLSA
jgi:aspartyl-tRNA(Asn)/glutamyl-tRNA(Gln) amidotransferase subunit B